MRVPRTFVFLDLTGFTSYTDAHGDEPAGRLLASFRQAVREVASNRGVRVAKWLGDGAMLVSVDEGAAIGFALELRDLDAEVSSPLAVRTGLATGEALLFEGDDYIGKAVNLAARLCDEADAREILAPATVAERLPEGVTAVRAGNRRLTGFADPVPVVHLDGKPRSSRDDTAELWTRSPFVV